MYWAGQIFWIYVIVVNAQILNLKEERNMTVKIISIIIGLSWLISVQAAAQGETKSLDRLVKLKEQILALSNAIDKRSSLFQRLVAHKIDRTVNFDVEVIQREEAVQTYIPTTTRTYYYEEGIDIWLSEPYLDPDGYIYQDYEIVTYSGITSDVNEGWSKGPVEIETITEYVVTPILDEFEGESFKEILSRVTPRFRLEAKLLTEKIISSHFLLRFAMISYMKTLRELLKKDYYLKKEFEFLKKFDELRKIHPVIWDLSAKFKLDILLTGSCGDSYDTINHSDCMAQLSQIMSSLVSEYSDLGVVESIEVNTEELGNGTSTEINSQVVHEEIDLQKSRRFTSKIDELEQLIQELIPGVLYSGLGRQNTYRYHRGFESSLLR
jgi:hypothetical protein